MEYYVLHIFVTRLCNYDKNYTILKLWCKKKKTFKSVPSIITINDLRQLSTLVFLVSISLPTVLVCYAKQPLQELFHKEKKSKTQYCPIKHCMLPSLDDHFCDVDNSEGSFVCCQNRTQKQQRPHTCENQNNRRVQSLMANTGPFTRQGQKKYPNKKSNVAQDCLFQKCQNLSKNSKEGKQIVSLNQSSFFRIKESSF